MTRFFEQSIAIFVAILIASASIGQVVALPAPSAAGVPSAPYLA